MIMKYNLHDIGGKVIKNDEYGIVRENGQLGNISVYSYFLYRNKSTKRFKFENHECIYFFIDGKGIFELEREITYINRNDIILAPQTVSHRIINTGDIHMRFLALKEKI